jgi:plasmid maintenance system antidote protein VapI
MTQLKITQFRDSLNAHMEATGMSVAKLARGTGIKTSQLYKLAQKQVNSTNVEDAVRIATFFGKSVEEFMDMSHSTSKTDAAVELMARLDPQHLDVVETLMRGLLASAPPA